MIATIIVPSDHCGPVMSLCLARRGEQLEHGFLGGTGGAGVTGSVTSDGGGGTQGSGGGNGGGGKAGGLGAPGAVAGDRVLLRYQLPLAELAGDFYSRLKTATHGCAAGRARVVRFHGL